MPAAPDLTSEEIERYVRHLTLPEVGVAGQKRLRGASVALVGVGGLGSPASLYLSAAGVGRIGLVDFDAVDISNLQRQVLYGSSDVGRPKLERARERMLDLNPHIEVEPHPVRLDAGNAESILGRYDIVLDGTDNFPTRYLVNDACVLLGKPNVYGSIFRFEGQVSVFGAKHGPCYRCLYPQPPEPGAVPNCAEGGVLGVLPGVIGSLQATEAIKLILGRGRSMVGRLLLFDALELRFRELRLRRDPDCPVCGEEPSIRALHDEAAVCVTPEPRTALGSDEAIEPEELRRMLSRPDPPLVLDVRTHQEWEICRLPGADLIPLQDLAARVNELDPSREIVLYCHHGGRSAMALQWLRGQGFENLLNLTGGIHAWSDRVDPKVPRY